MLFLGCGLQKDRTLDVLESILENGVINYAILPCKKNKIDETKKRLGDMRIQAILYPEGKHESVRIILEQLLNETNPNAYKDLELNISAENLRTNEEKYNSRFLYDSGLYGFVGRETELASLVEFIEDKSTFKWWAIVGPGGIGKSRLALMLKDKLSTEWDCKLIKQEDYEAGLGSIRIGSKRTLFIADYVQAYAEEIGNWIKTLSNTELACKVRVLLLERDAGDWPDRIRNRFKGDVRAQQFEYNKTERMSKPFEKKNTESI